MLFAVASAVVLRLATSGALGLQYVPAAFVARIMSRGLGATSGAFEALGWSTAHVAVHHIYVSYGVGKPPTFTCF